MATDPDAALHRAVPGKYKPVGAAPPPPSSGTLADVIEQGPDLRGVRPAGPDSFAKPPSFGELFSASRPAALRSIPEYDEVKLREGYAPIVDALGLSSTQNPFYFSDNLYARDPVLQQSALLPHRTMIDNLTDRPTQERLIAQQIHARRATDANFLPGVPDTVDGLHDYFEQLQAKKRAAASSVLARGPGGLTQLGASLAGGGFESAIHDPVQLPLLLLGGGTATTLLQATARDALINGVLAAAQLPATAHNMAENDEHLTAGEAVGNVLASAAFGAVVGGTVHTIAPHVAPALFKIMPESVQRRWADRMTVGGVKLTDVLGDMDNRELAGFARSTIGEKMTPDEKAAANLAERGQEMGETSPFMAGPAGDGAHRANLADALNAVVDGAARQAPRGSADLLAGTSLRPPGTGSAPIDLARASGPHDIVDFFKAKGLDDAHAYGIAAGIMAESGGDHTIVNPKSGASFLGQWMGSRLEGLKARFGPSPSRAEQLEYLWHELNGGDPGGAHVLGAEDVGSVLDAYIRQFMRPHAGAETLGDLERGMEALGRKGEVPQGAGVAAAGDEDLVAAAQRDADQADAEALAGFRSAEDADAELGRGHDAAPDAADMPILKRELFGSDADWAEAQIAFARSQGLIPDVAEAAANGPPARETASGPAELAPAAAASAQGAPGESAPITVQSYVDAYLAGRGRGDSARDRELLQFAANNGPAIETELSSRAKVAPESADYPVWQAKRIGAFDQAITDYAEANGMDPQDVFDTYDAAPDDSPMVSVIEERVQELMQEGVRDSSRTYVRSGLPRNRASNDAGGRAGSPDRGATGNMDVAGPIDNVALKAFDDAGHGRAELADSLEHDYRAAATADPERAKRAYEVDGRTLTLAELLDEFDRDREAAAALRACAGGGA